MLIIDNLHVRVAGKDILRGLSLSVRAGEVHAIMGPNGAGKSTLGHVLAGREGYEVTAGSVTYDGRDLLVLAPEERAALGVFLAFQYPVEIPGVNNTYFLRAAFNAQRKYRGEPELDAGKTVKEVVEEGRRDVLALLADYEALWAWSVADIERCWARLWEYFGLVSSTPFARALGAREMPGAQWFPGARVNYARHLLRDAQYAIDAGDDRFAPGIAALIGRACAIARRREELSDAALRRHEAGLDRQLNAVLAIEPRGEHGRKFKQTIKRFRQHMLVFVTNRNLPPTNNGSEQAIRPCVTFRKVTNCFRSEWGARLYANIRSVLETARRRTINPLAAIRLTLEKRSLLAAT